LHDDFAITAIMMTVDPTTVRMKQRLAADKFRINGVELAPADKTSSSSSPSRRCTSNGGPPSRRCVGRQQTTSLATTPRSLTTYKTVLATVRARPPTSPKRSRARQHFSTHRT
jgi:hypothetical protein